MHAHPQRIADAAEQVFFLGGQDGLGACPRASLSSLSGMGPGHVLLSHVSRSIPLELGRPLIGFFLG